MIIVIDMQTGEVERRGNARSEERKPSTALPPMPALQLVEHVSEQPDTLPPSLANVDVETFLRSMRRR